MINKFENEIFTPYSKIPEYLISNFGRVYSTKTNKILKNRVNKKGYAQVALQNKLGIPVDHKVHRLVAEIYISNPANKKEVNHIDNNKLNNNVNNLEWCTREENMKHCQNQGRMFIPRVQGSNHPDSIVTEEIVLQIRKLNSEGISRREIANKFNLNIKHIGKLVRREIWKHI